MKKFISTGTRLITGLVLTFLLSHVASAEITDLSSAINKAGRERMLSQRIAKAYLQIGQNVDVQRSQQVLDASIALFDHQLIELKTYAPTPEIRDVYTRLEQKWGQYKEVLIGKNPNSESARQVLEISDEVLDLAHQGTVLYEKESGKPGARLVNKAGRERMLSQRMAKWYQAAAWGIDVKRANTEIEHARAEFLAALEELRGSGLNSREVSDQIKLADVQWVFFDLALKDRNDSKNKVNATNVATTSERILQVMDTLTGLYERVSVVSSGGTNEKVASGL